MKALLLDIEGTTTPIDFVHKVLFPYSRARMDAFVEEHFAELGAEIEALSRESEADISNGTYSGYFNKNSPSSISGYLKYLIESDRKSTPLKTIQGSIWRRGYESGDLVSQVYEDVPMVLRDCKDKGISVNIYSSGSVLAQVLLFRHTDRGDLTNLIDNYFDTNIGHKRERGSYRVIAERIGKERGEIIFVSDVEAELDAAAASGMDTWLAVREGNPPQENRSGHKVINSLAELAGKGIVGAI